MMEFCGLRFAIVAVASLVSACQSGDATQSGDIGCYYEAKNVNFGPFAGGNERSLEELFSELNLKFSNDIQDIRVVGDEAVLFQAVCQPLTSFSRNIDDVVIVELDAAMYAEKLARE